MQLSRSQAVSTPNHMRSRTPALLFVQLSCSPRVSFVLALSVCPVSIRLVSLATQHFLSDVLHDAQQFHRLRNKDSTKPNVRGHSSAAQPAVMLKRHCYSTNAHSLAFRALTLAADGVELRRCRVGALMPRPAGRREASLLRGSRLRWRHAQRQCGGGTTTEQSAGKQRTERGWNQEEKMSASSSRKPRAPRRPLFLRTVLHSATLSETRFFNSL